MGFGKGWGCSSLLFASRPLFSFLHSPPLNPCPHFFGAAGSPGRSAASAVACASIAAGAHAAWGSHGWVRGGLRRAGLVGEAGPERAARLAGEAAAAAAAGSTEVGPIPWALRWLPIRRMSPVEAAAHKASKKEALLAARKAAEEGGGLPAAVERKGR